jgi:hypothetical protein
LNRSSNRRAGSSVAHRCSLAWIPSTRASASSKESVGHGAPASESRCAPSARACAAARPISVRLEPVLALRGFDHWFTRRYAFPPRLPGPGRLAVPTRPVVVGAAPTLPGASRLGLPPASPGCCDNQMAKVLHLRTVRWRLMAHHRLPIDPGRLHPDDRHPEAGQPVAQQHQPRSGGPKRPGLGPAPALVTQAAAPSR